MSIEVSFNVVLRGYDRTEVQHAIEAVQAALRSPDPRVRAEAAKDIQAYAFTVGLRGYDRLQVDDYLRRAAGQLAATAG